MKMKLYRFVKKMIIVTVIGMFVWTINAKDENNYYEYVNFEKDSYVYESTNCYEKTDNYGDKHSFCETKSNYIIEVKYFNEITHEEYSKREKQEKTNIKKSYLNLIVMLIVLYSFCFAVVKYESIKQKME